MKPRQSDDGVVRSFKLDLWKQPDRETPISWLLFQGNLGKLAPERLNQSGF